MSLGKYSVAYVLLPLLAIGCAKQVREDVPPCRIQAEFSLLPGVPEYRILVGNKTFGEAFAGAGAIVDSAHTVECIEIEQF